MKAVKKSNAKCNIALNLPINLSILCSFKKVLFTNAHGFVNHVWARIAKPWAPIMNLRTWFYKPRTFTQYSVFLLS